MTFNVSKCPFLQISKKMVGHPGYNLCDVELDQVDFYQYFGIHLQSSLKWDKHINERVNKATQKLAMIRRVLKFADTKKIAYFSIVRPTLEFTAQVWDPYH